MKNMLKLLLLFALATGCVKSEDLKVDVEIKPQVGYTSGNLVATDALGRTLPTYSEVGGPRKDKHVAMFYWTWHTSLSQGKTAKDVSKVLAQHPEAANDWNHPAWQPDDGGYYYWGEPLFDYYLDTDPWVLRKHAEMLAEAGVDAIVFDCTNGSFTWKESYMAVADVFSKAQMDGVKVPKIAFLLGFIVSDDTRKALTEIYNDLYEPGLYEDVWFNWAGKPLMMHYHEAVSGNEDIENFFTWRPGWPSYGDGGDRTDQWGWLQIYPQHGFGDKGDGRYEMTTVGVAQNWSKELGLTAMNGVNVFGRSYTDAKGHNPDPDATNYGYNFQEQWDYALAMDPDLLFVTGWNEWIAGRLQHWNGVDNAFPDLFNQEYSRDVEPMKGGHGDNYYYQLAQNIRRYKGVEPAAAAPRADNIAIDGDFSQWDPYPAFESYAGNAIHRNHPGWLGDHYTNTTGRNDIVRSKVAYDDENLYFYVETAQPLTPDTDPHWMMLFINSDRDPASGWEGYDFVVNRLSPDGKAIVERSEGGWSWTEAGRIDYSVRSNKLELAIPRQMIGQTGAVELEFKWVDNMQQEGDIMDFYLSGDCAPLGRYNYLFIE